MWKCEVVVRRQIESRSTQTQDNRVRRLQPDLCVHRAMRKWGKRGELRIDMPAVETAIFSSPLRCMKSCDLCSGTEGRE